MEYVRNVIVIYLTQGYAIVNDDNHKLIIKSKKNYIITGGNFYDSINKKKQ